MRAAVRRDSRGAQVPWESTSLEEDFWFIPPREVKELADHEIEQERTAELALWERIQNASKPEPLEIYEFGEFTMDVARGCVLRNGEEIKLRPKVFETLKYLVEHAGRLISKQELMQAVWPDAFVHGF